MRKVLLAILAIAAVIIVAAGIFLTSRVRAVAANLAQRVESQTGAHVTSAGIPGISFWPRFSVSLGNVVIEGAKDVTSGPLATIETMRIVPAGGLLGLSDEGIAEVILERPSINLIVSADGRANWNYGLASQPSEQSHLPLSISEGRIAFLDERTGAAVELTKVESQVEFAGPSDELNAKGAFVWNQRRAAFTLFLKSPQRVAEDGSPTDLTIQAPGLDFQFSGRTALTSGFELDGQSRLNGTDLGLAASWFGATLPLGMNGARFQLAGAVETSSKGLAFTKAEFALDDMNGEGDIALALSNGRPMIEAKVKAQAVDMTRYGSASTAPGPSLLAMPWSSKPIDLSVLRSFDADLDVSAQAFARGTFRTGPVHLTTTLHAGKLDLKLDKAAYVGGTLDLALAVDSKAEPPAFQFSVNGDNLAADKALLASVGLAGISGSLSPSISVSATGHTLDELVSTLQGQASFRIVSGAIKAVDLKGVFGQVATAIVEGWGGDAQADTTFEAFSASFTIADGIAATTNLVLASPSVGFTGKGEIDLLRQAVDLKVDPQLPMAGADASTPQLAKFPVAIAVKGPWTAPRIYPDMPGILEDPAAAYAALKKLGLGSAD